MEKSEFGDQNQDFGGKCWNCGEKCWSLGENVRIWVKMSGILGKNVGILEGKAQNFGNKS